MSERDDAIGGTEAGVVTAAVLVIGDEILSGRTRDSNLAMIGEKLGDLGIEIVEARVVRDIESHIVEAVNALRARYDYVFTTGGIGPTHDDITADCIAAAFGVPIGLNPEAFALLETHYPSGDFTPSRQRMARTPEGASLIANPVSTAPGFQVENVFVLAGIPLVAKAMMEGLEDRLSGGEPLKSRTLVVGIGESKVAEALGAIQARYPQVRMGSYPFYKDGGFGTKLVLRARDHADLDAAFEEVREAVRALGIEPVEEAG
jgi:molybdenum cofactor synthesis domain-containing protein